MLTLRKLLISVLFLPEFARFQQLNFLSRITLRMHVIISHLLVLFADTCSQVVCAPELSVCCDKTLHNSMPSLSSWCTFASFQLLNCRLYYKEYWFVFWICINCAAVSLDRAELPLAMWLLLVLFVDEFKSSAKSEKKQCINCKSSRIFNRKLTFSAVT